MNELDPGLKRLLKWARTVSSSGPETVPFGFSSRVVASIRRTAPLTLLQELQRSAWGLACASMALVLCGAIVLVSQRPSLSTGAEISSVLNFFTSNLLR